MNTEEQNPSGASTDHERVVGKPHELSVPMTSIDAEENDVKGMHAYLTACASQAQIALIHLNRLWSHEGVPADLAVWRSAPRSLELWADIQGALTAGIILSRLLRPTQVHVRKPLSKNDSELRSRERGRRLRHLLQVADDSVLLTISRVRDPLEHFDERMDRAVEDPDVYSISDLYVANDVYFDDLLDQADLRPQGGTHINMRTFVPQLGMIMYGRVLFDLFAFEGRLHALLEAVPGARQTIERQKTVSSRLFGASRPLAIDPGEVESRRAALGRLRQDPIIGTLRDAERVADPGTMVMRIMVPSPSTAATTGDSKTA